MSKKTNLIVGAAATVAATSLLVGCNLYGKETYKITFETNGGNPLAPVEIEWGEEFDLNVTPTKKGHTFKGWFFDAGLTNPVTESIVIEGDISLFAKWEINQYTVKFDTNGGNNIADIKANYDAEVKVDDPVRKGYEFVGWYLDEEFEEEFDLKIPGNNTTVYAKWEECEVKIIFNTNANGVVGEMGKPTFKTEDEKLTLPKSTYVREGYNFKGWATSENGEVVYEDEANISSLLEESQEITLYAVWEAKEHELHFVSNGLAYGDDIKVRYDENIVLPSTNPTKDGHNFLGWGQYNLTVDSIFAESKIYYTYDSVSKIYSVANVTAGDTVAANTYYEAVLFDTTNKMPNSNLQLNAVWSIGSYTISFNSNGAGTIDSITQAYGSAITLPSSLSKTGYTFKGWYKDVNLSNIFDSATMPLNGASLYAKWEANKYSVYFDANQGNGTTSKVDATYDVETTLTTNSFERVGYSFAGWNTKLDGTGTAYTDGQIIKNLLSEDDGSLTLYAQWTPKTDTKYVINHYTYNLDGSSKLHKTDNLVGESDKTVDVELLDITGFITPTAKTIKILPDGTAVLDVYYEREEYTVTFSAVHPESLDAFLGTSIEVKYEGTITFPSNYDVKNYSLIWKFNGVPVDGSTVVTSDMTLVAEYTRIEKTIVVHNEGQANQNIANVDAGTIIVNQLPTLEKVGHDFGGWYLDPEFTEKLLDDYVMPENNIDVYAKWNIKQYSISFDSGVASITQNYGTSVVLPTPSKTGYIFGGWLKEGQPYTNSTIPAENISLTAKWDAISYSIVFDANGGTGTTAGINNIKYGTSVGLTSVGFERKGYSFQGWSLDKNAATATYLNTAEVSNLSSTNGASVTLYAIWEINTYTYNFIIVDESGNTVETISTQQLHYDVNIANPNTNKPDAYPSSYTFDGWYSEPSCTNKVIVDEKAYTSNVSHTVNYYGKYSTEKYKVQFRNGNDGIIFETTSDGDISDTSLEKVQADFYAYINNMYMYTVMYDTIYDGLAKASNLQAPDITVISGIKIYFVFCLELDFDSGDFKDLPVFTGFKDYDQATKIQCMNQGTRGLISVEAATQLVGLFEGRFDFTDSSDLAYINSILNATDMVTMELAMQATSVRKINITNVYDDYRANAFCPPREGYIFNGWKVVIDDVNNVKIVDATWVKKLETPVNVRVQSTKKDSVVYAWNQVDGASSYTVTYTVKQGETVIKTVTDTTEYLYYEVGGLPTETLVDGNYVVEIKVKANNSAGTHSNQITLPDGVALDPTVTKVIESTQIESDYSSVVSYEHIVITAPTFGEDDIGPNYYRDKTNRVFYFFESNYYEFKGVSNIEILEGSNYAYYENGELHINPGSVGQRILLEITPTGQEPIEYSAYIQPKITSISYGSNWNTYLNAKEGKAKYLNKEATKYYVGASSNDSSKAHNGYSYENELDDKTYYNGFKFDIDVDTISGDTYKADEFTKDQFQLAYKFYDLSNPLNTDFDKTNNVATPAQDLYVRDVENDVFYFLATSGQYRVDVSYKTDGYYLTEDKAPISNKDYYDQEGNKIENVGDVFVPGVDYYEEYISMGLQNNMKNDSSSSSKFNLSFVINLDDSINIYDSKSLRSAHADPDVGNISIHSNIKANFFTDQIIQKDYFNLKMPSNIKLDSYFITYKGNVDVKEDTAVFSNEEGLKLKIWARGNGEGAIKAKDGNLYHYVGDGGEYSLVDAEWVNNWESGQFITFNADVDLYYDYPQYGLKELGFSTISIFKRDANNMPNGLTVNGNYFTIDASEAPYVQSDTNSSQTGAYKIQNTRANIFETTKGDTFYKNMTVIGNTQNYSANSNNAGGTSLTIEKYMEQTSGGLLGFKSYSTSGSTESNYGENKDVGFENIVIENVYVGISSYRRVSIDVNYVYINNAWSNSVVCWNSNNTVIRNSTLKNSGGSAIHINDGNIAEDANGNRINSMEHPEYGVTTCNPSLTIDFTTTTIENMVSGEEPWFKQHGMEVAALNLKSGLEAIANNFEKSIIQIVTDPVTLRLSEKMNFIGVGMCDALEGASPLDKGCELTLQGYVVFNDGTISYQNIPVPGSTTGDTFTIYTNGTNWYIEYVTYLLGSPTEILVEMV